MRSAIKAQLVLTSEQEKILDGSSRICNWLYNFLLSHANDLKKEFKCLSFEKETHRIAMFAALSRAEIADSELDTIENRIKEIIAIVYTERGLRDLIPDLKKQVHFLKTVYAKHLKEAGLRVAKAIQRYQAEKKTGNKNFGWPKFRKWSQRWFSLYYDEPYKGYSIDLKNKILTVTMGKSVEGKFIRLNLQLLERFDKKYLSAIKTLRPKKDHGKYFAVFEVDHDLIALPKNKKKGSDDSNHGNQDQDNSSILKNLKIVAIDPNHKNFGYAVSSIGEGFEIHNPYFLKNLEKRIDELKSKRDKCNKKSKKMEEERIDPVSGEKIIHSYFVPSKRWIFLNNIIMSLSRKRQEQTKVFLYTLANMLFKHYDIVSVGDYVPRGGGLNKGMRRHMNNFSLNGRFKKVLEWVSKKSGKVKFKRYLEWNEYRSTKRCSNPNCNGVAIESINPSIRYWRCSICGTIHIRDENSAINGLNVTYSLLENINTNGVFKLKQELPCSGHHPLRRCAWRTNGLGVQKIPGTIGVIDLDKVVDVKTSMELN